MLHQILSLPDPTLWRDQTITHTCFKTCGGHIHIIHKHFTKHLRHVALANTHRCMWSTVPLSRDKHFPLLWFYSHHVRSISHFHQDERNFLERFSQRIKTTNEKLCRCRYFWMVVVVSMSLAGPLSVVVPWAAASFLSGALLLIFGTVTQQRMYFWKQETKRCI